MAIQQSTIAVRRNSREAMEWSELEAEIRRHAKEIYQVSTVGGEI